MSHSRPWGTGHPGCLIFLLDQSFSMNQQFGMLQSGKGFKKCDVVAMVLNNILQQLTERNTVGITVRDRADIAVLGYSGSEVYSALGGDLSTRDFVTLTELKSNPLEERTERKKVFDISSGGYDIVESPVMIWVSPLARDLTPMGKALRKAHELASHWANEHPTSYPPVIVNVTDGEATDCEDTNGDFTPYARELQTIQTKDGHALLFNCHITNTGEAQITFPGEINSVPKNAFAQMLYETASVIPDSARQNYIGVTGEQLADGARGFIYNGDAASLHKMFNFATVPAMAIIQVQPNLPAR